MFATRRSLALWAAAGFVALVALAIGWLFFADLDDALIDVATSQSRHETLSAIAFRNSRQ